MTGRSRDDISLAPKAAPTGAAYDRDAYTYEVLADNPGLKPRLTEAIVRLSPRPP
jgi:hypothetical protein